MRHAVKARRGVASRQHFFAQPGDCVVVFGMHHDQRALAPRHRQHIENLPVVKLEKVVGRINLE